MGRNNLDDENEIQFGHDDPEPEIEDGEEEDSEEQDSEEPSIENDDESLPDSLPEESMADEPEGRPKGTKKRDRAQTRINHIMREKFHVEAELQKTKAILAETEKMRELSSVAGMRQYEENAATRMERARAMQIAAIESGDAQAQADASVELSSATNELHTLNNWKQQNDYEKRNQYYQEPAIEYSPVGDEILHDWVKDNEWFNPNSPRHDKELAECVNHWSLQLDRALINEGNAHKIRSSEYFDYIDDIARQAVEFRNNHQSGQRRDLNMKPVRGGASPVRGYSQGGGSMSQRKEMLNPDERDMARRMGVTDKVYLQYRLRDQQENPNKRRGR
jgi:hypothetical protein